MQEKPFIRITDTTLRDGSHTVRHQFTTEQVRAVARGLDAAGVPVIEVTHGDGLGGSSAIYGFARHTDEELIAAAAAEIQNARLAVLLLPGIGIKRDLETAVGLGARVVRVATHCTEADIAEQHIGLVKKLGAEAVGFLMMAHMASPAKLAEQARMMEAYGADVVYIVDSAGYLLPDDVRARIAALRAALRVEVGFHAHNNLGAAIANSLAAVAEGATHLDGSLRSMGAGAGNTATELLAAVLERLGYPTGVNPFLAMDVAEEVVAGIMERPPVLDRDVITLGYLGVYSSFLLHARRAAERFGVSARDVLMEVARRKAVGGQEDLLTDVARELAQRGPAPFARQVEV